MTTAAVESVVSPQVQAAIDATHIANVSLADRAMLVSFSCSVWNQTKTDKRASREAANKNNAAEGAVRLVKNLAGDKARASTAKSKLDAVHKKHNEARAAHYFLTRSWRDNGDRILSVDARDLYMQTMAQHKIEFDALVDDFVPFYPDLVREAALPDYEGGLGDLWKASDYPPASEIRSHFGMGVFTFPMPDASDFRADIGEIEIQRVRRQLTGVIEQALAQSNRDYIEQLLEPVAHMAKKLAAYKNDVGPDGKREVSGKFHDTLVENVRKQVAVVPMLNITNDPGIAALAREIEASLTTWDADVLRESESKRKQVAAEAQRILDHVSDFLA